MSAEATSVRRIKLNIGRQKKQECKEEHFNWRTRRAMREALRVSRDPNAKQFASIDELLAELED